MQTMTKNVINKVTPKVVVNDTKVKEEAKKAEKKAIQEARNELLKPEPIKPVDKAAL